MILDPKKQLRMELKRRSLSVGAAGSQNINGIATQ